MSKASEYRHTLPKEGKRDLWYPDLRVNQAAGDATCICCGEEYIAVNWSSSGGGTVAILDYPTSGKRKEELPTFRAHSGALCDMAFSPFDRETLATSGEEALIKLWKIPSGGLPSLKGCPSLQSPTLSLSGHRKKVDSIAFSPVCSSLLASSSSDKSVRVWDLEAGTSLFNTPDGLFGDAVWSVSWNWTGSLLAATCKDRKIRLIDPRADGDCVLCSGDGHPGLKAAKGVWMGKHELFISCGFSKTNTRQVAVWDPRELSKPLVLRDMGSASGATQPLYDPDADLLFLASKGESAIRLIQGIPEAPYLQDLSVAASQQITKGACLVPKRCLDVCSSEVNRVLRVTANAVIPTAFFVPRSKRGFHEDLFPDTLALEPAQTVEEWKSGETKTPNLSSLKPTETEPEPEPVVETRTETAPVSASSAGEEAPKKKADACYVPKETSAPKEAEPEPVQRTFKRPANIVKYTKFRHIAGKPFMKNTHLEEVRINPNAGRLVRVNKDHIALSWAGPGGRVIVLPLSRPGGRVASDTPFLEHGSLVTDMEWNPFVGDLLATAGEDARVRLWKVPEGGCLTETTRDATMDLLGHTRKITCVGFHPAAANLAYSGAFDGTVRLWDVEKGAEAHVVNMPGDATLYNLSWDYSGKLFAAACQDKKLHIVDPRSDTFVSEVLAHEGGKGFRAEWAGRQDAVITAGFSRSSERVLAFWDTRNMVKPVATKTVDSQSGVLAPHFDADTNVLILGGRGDSGLKFYECAPGEEVLRPLTEFQMGTPFADFDLLPKTSLDVKGCEMAQVVRVTGSPPSIVERISLVVPRTRTEYFQDDIFPPTRGTEAPLSAAEWLDNAEYTVPEINLCPEGMTPLSQAPPEQKAAPKYHMPTEEEREAQQELTRDVMFDRIFARMQSKQETESIEERDRATRAAEAAAGNCAAEEEWEDDE